MTTQAKLKKLISQLEQEKDQLCVSVIVPTSKLSKGRTQNPERIRKAVNKTKTIIKGMSKSKALAAELSEKLDSLHSSFDNLHARYGVGFFVSSNISLKIDFPFEVQERLIVGNSFEVRDLYYYQQFATEYFILLLTIRKAQLFRACMDEYEEINDENFPAIYEDEYEYATPARASSMRNALQTFERDKNQIKEIRQQAFFKNIDASLGNYLTQKTPVILAGVGEQIAMFKKESKHAGRIEGEVIGNFTRDYHLMATQAWKKIRSHQINHDQTQQIHDLTEGIGRKRVVSGVREVWKAIQEGRGLALYVEKDFEKKGYLSKSADQLFLKPPKMKYDIIEDIVDDALEIAKKKKTAVFFVENDKLEKLDRIALALRY